MGRIGFVGHHDVFKHAHAFEQANVLERAPNAKSANVMQASADQAVAHEIHLPAVSLVETSDGVDQSGFASTVGANQTQYFAGCDVQVNAIEGMDAPEVFGQLGNGQDVR